MSLLDTIIVVVLSILFVVILDLIRVEYQYKKWAKGVDNGSKSNK